MSKSPKRKLILAFHLMHRAVCLLVVHFAKGSGCGFDGMFKWETGLASLGSVVHFPTE